jgi:hypothetical protein
VRTWIPIDTNTQHGQQAAVVCVEETLFFSDKSTELELIR